MSISYYFLIAAVSHITSHHFPHENGGGCRRVERFRTAAHGNGYLLRTRHYQLLRKTVSLVSYEQYAAFFVGFADFCYGYGVFVKYCRYRSYTFTSAFFYIIGYIFAEFYQIFLFSRSTYCPVVFRRLRSSDTRGAFPTMKTPCVLSVSLIFSADSSLIS